MGESLLLFSITAYPVPCIVHFFYHCFLHVKITVQYLCGVLDWRCPVLQLWRMVTFLSTLIVVICRPCKIDPTETRSQFNVPTPETLYTVSHAWGLTHVHCSVPKYLAMAHSATLSALLVSRARAALRIISRDATRRVAISAILKLRCCRGDTDTTGGWENRK